VNVWALERRAAKLPPIHGRDKTSHTDNVRRPWHRQLNTAVTGTQAELMKQVSTEGVTFRVFRSSNGVWASIRRQDSIDLAIGSDRCRVPTCPSLSVLSGADLIECKCSGQ